MPRREHIGRLLHKASQDEYVVDRLLPDDRAPLEMFGLHAQQATEKLLKAVPVATGAQYPRTHRLAELMDLPRAAGVEVPLKFDDPRYLTPFAVEFRYDVTPEEDDDTPLDKQAIRGALRELKAWTTDTIDALV